MYSGNKVLMVMNRETVGGIKGHSLYQYLSASPLGKQSNVGMAPMITEFLLRYSMTHFFKKTKLSKILFRYRVHLSSCKKQILKNAFSKTIFIFTSQFKEKNEIHSDF
ncbi:hypothetical protein M153_950003872 [Pseudoloma neurophilia]|uniref:Uncharacterized protein n=1 Tax=Pseudoloma neurophilia TaxID=146866 RepID=A0A0R0M464_9MICR|nr:hypothetical protein M153_950003872 [Pseudoloma neurophilia]